MATIYNADLKKELIDGAKIQLSRDIVPGDLAKSVVPTMEVNPKFFRVCNINVGSSSTSTGTKIIYTTPSNKDFYLTNISGSYIKDAACDIATAGGITLTAVINGKTEILNSMMLLTLTAEKDSVSLNYNTPIKIDRGSNIYITGVFTAGVLSRGYSLNGYTVED